MSMITGRDNFMVCSHQPTLNRKKMYPFSSHSSSGARIWNCRRVQQGDKTGQPTASIQKLCGQEGMVHHSTTRSVKCRITGEGTNPHIRSPPQFLFQKNIAPITWTLQFSFKLPKRKRSSHWYVPLFIESRSQHFLSISLKN